MTKSLFLEIFPVKKPIIGMIHIFSGELRRQIDQALEDADRLQEGGVDGLLVENYGCGYFYYNYATNEMKNRLIEIARAVKKNSKIPVGVNVLPNDYWAAFEITRLSDGVFIQMDHITGDFEDCESVDSKNFSVNRKKYEKIAVFGGVHPKYYRLANPACSLAECAKKAMLLADGVVVTGDSTGDAVSIDDLRTVFKAIGSHPIIIGSGLNSKNAREQLSHADGAIVGTAFKKGGVHRGVPVDVDLISRLMDEVERLR